MKVDIYSREAVKELIKDGFPKNVAIVSFYTPKRSRSTDDVRVDYSLVCDRVFYIAVPDIDLVCLADYGYTYGTYIEDTAGLAEFIYEAHSAGLDIICQCDYGQSRSAACAAAIIEHFESRGIDIFCDYKYYPNQLVYHKVLDALREYEKSIADTNICDGEKTYSFEQLLATLPKESEKTYIVDKLLSALGFLKATSEFVTADMQRYLRCGYGDTYRILDALLLLGAIEKVEKAPAKYITKSKMKPHNLKE